jgi:membrane-bound lytic murein transglycosylase D
LVSWQVYQAPNGQTLDDIARRFNTSVSNLRAHNPIDEKRNKLNGAHTLLVPIAFKRPAPATAAPTQQPVAEISPAATSALQHTVVQGDSLYAISRRYGIKVDELMSINGLDSIALKLGQILRLPIAATAAPSVVHAITGTDAVAQQVVQPVTPPAVAVAPVSKAAFKTYTVQYGDTMYAIARQYGVALSDLLSWNNISPSTTLKPGMTMKISMAN